MGRGHRNCYFVPQLHGTTPSSRLNKPHIKLNDHLVDFFVAFLSTDFSCSVFFFISGFFFLFFLLPFAGGGFADFSSIITTSSDDAFSLLPLSELNFFSNLSAVL